MLIVFEGIDGSGKSTQVNLLSRKLQKKGQEVIVLREPTSGKWGEKIRKLARIKGSISPEEELQLFLKDRKENISLNIAPALKSGKIVILDRYYYSTLAYQGARGISLEKIRHRHHKFLIKPDIAFILDVPAGLGLRRIKDRPVIYHLFEDKNYLKRVRKIFLSLNDPEVVVLDGRQPAKDISREVWLILKKKFPLIFSF
ncbi:MAG: dTMP kinase [Candidatus Aminicenantes bacterium]|nr:MAG: dTMP kinase [Candidatus Aminicenantes bacterium]